MKASRRQLAMLRSLQTRKGRKETGLFLVEGVRLCSELAPARARVELLVVAEERKARPEVAEVVRDFVKAGVTTAEIPERDFGRVSDTVKSQGIIAAARWEDFRIESLRFGDRATVVALDSVSDPGNVGTLIRTAAWFGADAVFLGEGCADLLNPKTVRATMGGIFHLPICRDVNLAEGLNRLKRLGFGITVATPVPDLDRGMDGSPNWSSWAKSPRSVLVLGSEAHGVSDELCRLAGRRITIPRRGKGESLNVAVSAGILLSAQRA